MALRRNNAHNIMVDQGNTAQQKYTYQTSHQYFVQIESIHWNVPSWRLEKKSSMLALFELVIDIEAEDR
jgi:hypothetical protein